MDESIADVISDEILKRGNWPLSDVEGETVKTLEDASMIMDYMREAFQISGHGSMETSLCVILQDSALLDDDHKIDMDAWAQITDCLVRIHRPSARHVTWLLSCFAMELGDCTWNFVMFFSRLERADLEYLTRDVNDDLLLSIWTSKPKPIHVPKNGPFTLEFAKSILRRDPKLSRVCYYRLYFSVLNSYGTRAVLELGSLHSVHFKDSLACLADENPTSFAYRLRAPVRLSIGLDEMNQLYTYDPKHPWTSAMSASNCTIDQGDLDFINGFRDKITNIISQFIPIRPLALEIKGYLFGGLPSSEIE